MIKIESLNETHLKALLNSIETLDNDRQILTIHRYLKEQTENKRSVWVAYIEDQCAGYVNLVFQSRYLYFKERGIPEINDLYVFPKYRKQGIGAMLLAVAEREAKSHSPIVGLGVGLYADYGIPQNMYIHRGYSFDGNGLTYNYQTVNPGSEVKVDDELLLWLTKAL